MKKPSSIVIIIEMLKLVKPLSVHLILAIIFGVLGHLAAIFVPVLGGVAILIAIGLVDFSLTTIFMYMIGCGIFRGVFAYIEQNRNHYIAFRILALIRDKVFGALRKLCPAKLEGKNRGDLITIMTADIELLEVFFAHTISPIFIAFMVGSIMTILMGSFHIIYGITAGVAYLVTGVFLPICMGKKTKELFQKQRKDSGDLSAYYMDSLRGILEIEQMNCGEKRLNDIVKKTENIEKSLSQISHQDGSVLGIADALVLGFSGLILVQTFFVSNGNFIHVLMPIIMMMSSFGPVLALSRLSTGLSRMLAAGNRVLTLLEEEPEVEENIHGKQPAFEDVVVNNLSFAYDKEIILEDISLKMEKEKIYGIYGKSGSGKSTLLKLLMRFWNAPAQSIQINQIDIGDVQTKHLRKMESYMTQEVDLFNQSILENIKIGNLCATKEEIIEAAKKASIHDFILTLPNTYDTSMGELGSYFSGGERQRLGMARAFLHHSDLMLLDEPTSNLDSLNEGIILKSLKEEQEKKTIVIVSHRKSTLAICEETISVDKGRLA